MDGNRRTSMCNCFLRDVNKHGGPSDLRRAQGFPDSLVTASIPRLLTFIFYHISHVMW